MNNRAHSQQHLPHCCINQPGVCITRSLLQVQQQKGVSGVQRRAVAHTSRGERSSSDETVNTAVQRCGQLCCGGTQQTMLWAKALQEIYCDSLSAGIGATAVTVTPPTEVEYSSSYDWCAR
jgi:hypothetical protein